LDGLGKNQLLDRTG